MIVQVPAHDSVHRFSWTSVSPPFYAECAIERLYSPYGCFFRDMDLIGLILKDRPLWTHLFPVSYTPMDQNLRVIDPYFMSPRPKAVPYNFIRDATSVGAYEVLRTRISAKELIRRGYILERSQYEKALNRTHVVGSAVCTPSGDPLTSAITETEGEANGYPYLMDSAVAGFTDYSFEPQVQDGFRIDGNPGSGDGIRTDYASTWRLIELLQKLEGYDITYSDANATKVHYQNVSVQGDGLGFVAIYRYRVSSAGSDYTVGYYTNRTISFQVLHPVNPSARSHGTARISMVSTREKYGDWGSVGWTPSKTSLISTDSQTCELVSMYHGKMPEVVRPNRIKRLGAPITDWPVLQSVGNGGPYHAVADAIHKHFVFFKTNWIEGLSELRDVAKLVPNFGALARAFRLVPGGNYIRAGLSLVDFFTGVKLLSDFGIRPTIGAANEFITQFDDLYRHITSTLGTTIILRGVARGTSSGYYGLDVESHVKMYAEFPHTALMAAILGLDGSGSLPRISRLWETVPFSFVIDWMFDIDERIEVHEDNAFVLLLDIQSYVTSTKVTSPIHAGELSAAGLSPVTNCTVVSYRRHVSVYPPSVEYDSIDYSANYNYPSVFTGGSLAYQVAKR